MSADSKLPFHSLSFTLLDNKRPRQSLKLSANDDGMYILSVQKGSATNPISQFERQIPREVAQRLRDTMHDAGVFGWDEAYGDSSAPGSRRWNLAVVFEQGVFSLESKGGSDTPPGFDRFLEELYRLDFPRPETPQTPHAQTASAPSAASSTASMLSNMDFTQLAGLMPDSEIASLMAEAQRNPQTIQQRMKDEFHHMTPDEQNRLLDALASTGLASRAWWERFFRG